MAYVYIFIILVAIVFGLFRMIMKKQKPSNRYTPYDNITTGTNTELKKDTPIKETKHHIDYVENPEPNKESDT